jgi:predicted dehydrogenase
VAAGRPASIAFAGAGLIAAVHRDAVDRIPGLHISAVASRSSERAAEAAGRLGATACTFDELPAGADAVLVATPPGHHAPLALALMASGVPVLVEKPLCTTLADADRLVAAVDAGGRLAYAENLVHARAVELALAHTADLGPIDHLEVRAIQPRPTWGDFLTEGWGGGVLFDLGAHPVALALLAASPARPVAVRATLAGAPDHPVDEEAGVSIRFDSGLEATLAVSWRATDEVVWDLQASSPAGVVRLELLPEVVVERNGETVPLPAPGPDGPTALDELGYVAQMAAFAADLAAGTAPTLSAAFGRSVLDATCGAYASAGQAGEWVALPFAGPRDRTPLELWRHP